MGFSQSGVPHSDLRRVRAEVRVYLVNLLVDHPAGNDACPDKVKQMIDFGSVGLAHQFEHRPWCAGQSRAMVEHTIQQLAHYGQEGLTQYVSGFSLFDFVHWISSRMVLAAQGDPENLNAAVRAQ
jgi:hypothetical protein